MKGLSRQTYIMHPYYIAHNKDTTLVIISHPQVCPWQSRTPWNRIICRGKSRFFFSIHFAFVFSTFCCCLFPPPFSFTGPFTSIFLWSSTSLIITQSHIVTTCCVTNWSNTHNSHQTGDSRISSRETKKKKKKMTKKKKRRRRRRRRRRSWDKERPLIPRFQHTYLKKEWLKIDFFVCRSPLQIGVLHFHKTWRLSAICTCLLKWLLSSVSDVSTHFKNQEMRHQWE